MIPWADFHHIQSLKWIYVCVLRFHSVHFKISVLSLRQNHDSLGWKWGETLCDVFPSLKWTQDYGFRLSFLLLWSRKPWHLKSWTQDLCLYQKRKCFWNTYVLWKAGRKGKREKCYMHFILHISTFICTWFQKKTSWLTFLDKHRFTDNHLWWPCTIDSTYWVSTC